MKRKIAILLSAVALLGVLTACKSEAAKAADEQIAAIGEVSLDSLDKITAAEKAVAALESKDKESLENTAILEAARAAYDVLVQEAEADKIEEIISEIGDVSLNSDGAISIAEEAYNAASDQVRARVENAAVLKKAKETYEILLQEAAADEIEKVISAIGTVTLDSGEAIAAAEEAYDQAPDEIKARVENAAEIEAAKAALAQLKAGEVEGLIDAIGTVTLGSEGAIEAAEQAYQALSQAEKDLVKNSGNLTAAADQLVTLKKDQANRMLSKLHLDHDKVRGMKFYYASTYYFYDADTWAADRRCFVLPYLGMDDNSVWMRLVCNYTAYDWIFFEKIIFAVDEERYSERFSYYDVTRDNSGGRVWEYVDIDVGDYEIEMLWDIVNSEETIIRFEGDDYYYDFTVNKNDKAAIRDILTIYEMLR